jgi:hypothetical protein
MPTKTCNTCNETKPIDQFPNKKSGRHGVAAQCKPCRAVWAKQWYDEHAEEQRAKKRTFHAENRERLNASFNLYQRKKYATDPEFRAKQIAGSRRAVLAARQRVFMHYGGNPPRCACCGEQEDAFLTLDHVNGGGGAHRKQVGSKGPNGVLYWLIRNDFPEGYSVLCWNCHMAKDRRGGCPHQS